MNLNHKLSGRSSTNSHAPTSQTERLANAKQKRHLKAVKGASAFASLPDNARVRQPIVEILHGISSATLWRRVKSGALPAPHVCGRVASWSAGEIRASLTMRAVQKVGGRHDA